MDVIDTLNYKPTVCIWDYDYLLYAACFAGEKRTIEVVHSPTGRVKEFKTRTEFYGRDKNKTGGWLGKVNQDRLQKGLNPFLLDEFEISDVQTPEPVENVLHTAKLMIQNVLDTVGCDQYFGYTSSRGGKPLFRLTESTLWEYKGNRKDMLSPIHKGALQEYLIKHHNAIMVKDDLEADDWVVIKYLELKERGEKPIIIAIDKDIAGCPVISFNPNKPEDGYTNGDCFGELYINEKNEVKGYGRKWLYYQTISSDAVDNYKANCFSEKKWGHKSAYNALVDCKTDKECFREIMASFKLLYPSPKEIVGWRGDKITIDWLYVANEMWNMARMRRTKKDIVTFSDVLKKHNLLKEKE